MEHSSSVLDGMCQRGSPSGPPVTQLSQSGTQPCQLDAQSGGGDPQSGQSGIQSSQSEPQSYQLGTQSRHSGTRADGALTPSNKISSFEISNPPRCRGRSKPINEAKLAERNRAVTMAREGSDLYNSNLSLASVNAAKPRAPIAREISKLLSTKRLIPQESVTRISQPFLLKGCSEQESALQEKHTADV
ncbi:hypothetical protein GQ600_13604 [Phytophthora cactorum]|nr:hypothetical protein GQ600_13604 [Phytophthora cactorum]